MIIRAHNTHSYSLNWLRFPIYYQISQHGQLKVLIPSAELSLEEMGQSDLFDQIKSLPTTSHQTSLCMKLGLAYLLGKLGPKHFQKLLYWSAQMHFRATCLERLANVPFGHGHWLQLELFVPLVVAEAWAGFKITLI